MQKRENYNLILLGGTGARCGEIFVHMCANGYLDCELVNILYIDSDQDNGNGQCFKKLVEIYQECQKQYRIPNNSIPCFFRPQIRLILADPVQGFSYFKDLSRPTMNSMMEDNGGDALMQALYSEEEQNMKISDGFFAHPNVGAALFAASMDKIMAEFLHMIQLRQDLETTKIFMIGSLFGGTGASSLPTISQYLRKTLFGNSDNKLVNEKLKIGGCMVLPYFRFSKENLPNAPAPGKGIAIESEKFATKTRSALEYYQYMDNDQSQMFESLYILGHDGNDIRGFYTTAGSTQRNLPHIVEFYGAMACVHFFESSMDERGRYFSVVGKNTIYWNDIYKNTRGYFNFLMMMRFAIVMKSLILEEMFDHTRENKLKPMARDIPWYYAFLDGKDHSVDMEEDQLFHKFESISRYCDEYIRWFAELNIADIHKVNDLKSISYKTVDPGEKSDVVEYLRFFSKELLIRQHQNNCIGLGLCSDMNDTMSESIYRENVSYIREHFTQLEEVHTFSNMDTEQINMSQIWSRICDLGFNSSNTGKLPVENISSAIDKRMDACVRNLVNAVYIACMI